MADLQDNQAPERRGVPFWVQMIIWVVLLGLLGLVAFGLQRAQQGTIQRGDVVPDFSLTFFDGYTYQEEAVVNVSALRGKVVVINFWASWCKPCEQEAAELESAWRYYQPSGEVVFLGIDYVDTEPEARQYLSKFDITYPNAPDLGTSVSHLFRIKGVPETYFIDKNGILQYVQVGPFISETQIRQIVDSLLNQ